MQTDNFKYDPPPPFRDITHAYGIPYCLQLVLEFTPSAIRIFIREYILTNFNMIILLFEQLSMDITLLWLLWRLVEKLPPGKPVSPEIAELEWDLRIRFQAHDTRRADWQRVLREQGR